jgi:hypothetical protein
MNTCDPEDHFPAPNTRRLLRFQDATFTNCEQTPNQMDITDLGKDATKNGHTLRLGGGILWVVIQAAIYVINHFAHSYLIFAEHVTIITTAIRYNLLQRCL